MSIHARSKGGSSDEPSEIYASAGVVCFFVSLYAFGTERDELAPVLGALLAISFLAVYAGGVELRAKDQEEQRQKDYDEWRRSTMEEHSPKRLDKADE